MTSYRGNLEKAFETDSQIEGNLKALQPTLALLKLSKDELTHKMPKSAASDVSSTPCY